MDARDCMIDVDTHPTEPAERRSSRAPRERCATIAQHPRARAAQAPAKRPADVVGGLRHGNAAHVHHVA